MSAGAITTHLVTSGMGKTLAMAVATAATATLTSQAMSRGFSGRNAPNASAEVRRYRTA
jgi:hypothetical protein